MKNNPDIKKLFLPSGCLQRQAMLDLINDKTDKTAYKAIKQHLEECELCRDAVDGLLMADQDEVISTLSGLSNDIKEKFGFTNDNNKNSGRKKFSFYFYASAAIIVLLAGLAFLIQIYVFDTKPVNEEIAQQDFKNKITGKLQEEQQLKPDDILYSRSENGSKNIITESESDNESEITEILQEAESLDENKKHAEVTVLNDKKTLISKEKALAVLPESNTIFADETAKPESISTANALIYNNTGVYRYNAVATGEAQQNEAVIQNNKQEIAGKKSEEANDVVSVNTLKTSQTQREKTLTKTQAVKFYDSGDYDQAAGIFEEIVSESGSSSSDMAYLGLSYYKSKEYRKAISPLETAIENKSLQNINEARFALAKCYLETGNIIKAEQLFKLIIQSENPYKAEAEKELKKLLSD